MIKFPDFPDFSNSNFWNQISTLMEEVFCISSEASIVQMEESKQSLDVLGELKNKDENLKKEEIHSLQLALPTFSDFQAQDVELQHIFSSLLEDQEGLIVGKHHLDATPINILHEQMQYLAEKGVGFLFLGFCCNFWQRELDHFLLTKKASVSLKDFLNQGDVNYYNLVEAAVNAGILPIALGSENRQELTSLSKNREGVKERILEFNVSAMEMINRYKGKKKYIALVESFHLSYTHDVAGLSELCHAPCLLIQAEATLERCKYQTYIKNEKLENKQCQHVVHVQLDIAINEKKE